MPNGEAASLAKLQRFVTDLRRRDGVPYEPPPRELLPGQDPALGLEATGRTESADLEAVIRLARPVLEITGDAVGEQQSIAPIGEEGALMARLVRDNAAVLNSLIPSVGRIELDNNRDFAWAGTGWIVDSELGDDIIVTNAHVARFFAEAGGAGFVFSPGTLRLGQPQSARIDFREEIRPAAAREFPIVEIIHISDREPLDVAFLRVRRQIGAARISPPIALADSDTAAVKDAAIIGYPGIDQRAANAEMIERIFGAHFEKKRLSPGRTMGSDAMGLCHDCSTLPGSSGSVLVEMASGKALGLHFHGVVLERNHAVPASAIRRMIRDRPWQGLAGRRSGSAPSEGTAGGTAMATASSVGSVAAGVTIEAGGQSVRITLPLEITIRIGGAAEAGGTIMAGVPVTPPLSRANAEAASRKAEQAIRDQGRVVAMRPGLLFRDGELTEDYGVIVKVKPEASRDAADYGLPAAIDGVPVAIEMADLDAVVDGLFRRGEEATQRVYGYQRDIGTADFSLDPIEDEMTIRLHVSPERGWPELRDFLARPGFDRLTIGMYHMTAPHVIEAIEAAAAPEGREMTLTIDRKAGDDIGGDGTKADDRPEAETLDALEQTLGDRFRWAPASIAGPGKLFFSSYHIKVAVLSEGDADQAFWLSSGNWQSSNQAPLEKPVDQLRFQDVKDYNREWHAVVENARLAGVFRRHLDQDFVDNDEAAGREAPAMAHPDLLIPEALLAEQLEAPRRFQAFGTKVIAGRIRVTPVLTPDNYDTVVTAAIRSARRSVLFENQSFGLSADTGNMPEHFLDLATALLEQQQNGRDVRIIFRSGFGKEKETIRRLVEFGFKKASIRFFDKVHTKGIVIDDTKVLLGSQNWTGAGTGPNRDASLLIENREAAAYFREIFEYDWSQMARSRVADGNESTLPVLIAGQEATIPRGYRRVAWRDFMDL